MTARTPIVIREYRPELGAQAKALTLLLRQGRNPTADPSVWGEDGITDKEHSAYARSIPRN